jgi:hypothetical protein
MISQHPKNIIDQEEMHFYSCVNDVLEAFLDHGVKDILREVNKNPKIHQQVIEYLQQLNK